MSVLLLLVPALASAALTPEQRRGRQIYREGTSPGGGRIVALMGEQTVEVPASIMPCAGCHGRDGRGRPEGGITPTELTWDNLTKPYGITHPTGRKHGPYDARSMKRAITMGLDPAGTRLHAAMPRFQMSQEDMADLLAYLQVLGREEDPGTSDGAVTIGVVLPPPGPLAPMGAAIRAALAARAAEWNWDGGVWGRRLELRFVEPPAPPAERRERVAAFLDGEEVFAAVAAFTAGADRELATLFAEREVPLVGPFTLHPRTGFPLNRYVFYLLSGVEAQGRALVRFATPSDGRPVTAAIVAPEDEELHGAVETVEKAMAAAGWPSPTTIRYQRGGLDPAGTARRIAGAGEVFLLGGSGAEAAALLAAVARPERTGPLPRVLATATAADAALFGTPAAFAGRLFVAQPTAPADQSPRAVAEYRRLAEASRLPAEHVSAQLSALAAAEVLFHGLRQAGRDLSRERLVEALEGVRQLQTGLVPEISYGPNRRVGAQGAWITMVDLAGRRLAPAGGWIEVE